MNTTNATPYEIVLKPVDLVRVASIRGLAPSMEQIDETLAQLFGTLEAYVERNGGAAGPRMAIYHDAGTGTHMRNTSVEALIPFEGDAWQDEQVTVYVLPHVMEMACTTHKGPYKEIGYAYKALFSWAHDHGYRVAGPTRDVFLTYGKGNRTAQVTEVQLPVAK
jgi:effector-binding domain-containing protein